MLHFSVESDIDFFEIFVPEDKPPSTDKEKLLMNIGYLKSDQRTSSVITGAVCGGICSVIILLIVAMDTPVILGHVKTMMVVNLKHKFCTR